MNDSLASTLVLCDLDNLLLGEDGNLTQVVRDVLQLFSSRGGRLHRTRNIPTTQHADQRTPARTSVNSTPMPGSAPTAVIGRERSQAQIVLRDPNVSRRHAELRFDGRDWRIADLNSTNGTLVNDVDVKECVLRDGDLITVGLVNLEFRENR